MNSCDSLLEQPREINWVSVEFFFQLPIDGVHTCMVLCTTFFAARVRFFILVRTVSYDCLTRSLIV